MQTRSLAEAELAAMTCQDCSLWKDATLVYGDGPASADLMFIGEAPGRIEDEQGVPFVGSAGQLLNAMLCEIGIRRRDVYVANVIKHRPLNKEHTPPKNRRPSPGEIRACTPWLHEQVELIDPKLIVPLGNVAARTILGRQVAIGRVHGRRFEWKDRTIIPTFHPAYIRRNSQKMMQAYREDFATIRVALDSETDGTEPCRRHG